jgi:hypothetical protein
MDEWTIDTSRHDPGLSASDPSRGGEQRHSMPVELLVGGLCIPGYLEYNARTDRVTFTMKKAPHAAPNVTWPEKPADTTDDAQPMSYMKQQREEL